MWEITISPGGRFWFNWAYYKNEAIVVWCLTMFGVSFHFIRKRGRK